MWNKGETGNPNGRPKNKVNYSAQLRQILQEWSEENAHEFLQEIKNLKPGKAKADAFLTILQFCIPKLTEANSTIDINTVSDEQLTILLENSIANQIKTIELDGLIEDRQADESEADTGSQEKAD